MVDEATYLSHSVLDLLPNDSVVDSLLSEAQGPLNFTMFLTLFGNKIIGRQAYTLYSLIAYRMPFITW